jgi:hypothetical protein
MGSVQHDCSAVNMMNSMHFKVLEDCGIQRSLSLHATPHKTPNEQHRKETHEDNQEQDSDKHNLKIDNINKYL